MATHDTAAALLDTGGVDESRASPHARRRVLTLEIDADGDPIAGRVSEGEAPGHEFVGWLGLARALELALEGVELPPGG